MKTKPQKSVGDPQDRPWLDRSPITPSERKDAKRYLERHKRPVNERTIRHRIARVRKAGEVRRYLQAKEHATTDVSPPWQIIYGEVKVGGTITFVHTTGPADQPNLYLHLVITLAAHQIERVGKVYFNEYELTWDTNLYTRPTGVVNATGIFAGYVYAQINYGTDGQSALSQLVTDCPASGPFPGWTTDHRQRGHSHIYLRLKWNEKLFKGGMPDITFLVFGKNDILDTRNSSTGAYQNAALIINDYMTNTRWGLGIPSGSIHTARLNAAADTCNETVPLAAGGNEYRYQINGHFGADDAPGEILKDMLAAMAGRLTFTEGKWNILAGKYPSETITLTEADILSDISVVTKTPRIDTFNAVRGTYASVQNDYDETDFPVVKNETYYAQDNNERIWTDLSFPFVWSPAAAQRIAKIHLEQNRQGILVEFVATLKAYLAEPGEVLKLTISRFGWSAKAFEVVRCQLLIDADDQGAPLFAVKMTVRETASAVYDWNSGNETQVDVAPNTNLPNPFTVADPTGLTLASGTSHLYLRNDGTVFSRLYASWTAPADAFVVNGGRIEVQFKKSVDSNWQDSTPVPGSSTNTYILDVDDGNNYDVRIRSVNALGARGNWVTVTGHTVIGKTALPSDVTGFTGQFQGFSIKLLWNAVADLDVREYEIRIGNFFSSWDDPMTVLTRVRVTNFYYEIKTAGNYRFRIKAIDTSGNYSANAPAVDLTVAAPSTPTLSVSFENEHAVLSWTEATGSFAIKEYEVRYGASYAAGTPVGVVTALRLRLKADWSGARTFWVAARDVAGNTGVADDAVATVNAPSTPTLSISFEGEHVVLSWTEATGTLAIKEYEIRYGANYATGTPVAIVTALRYRFKAEWSGARTFWVAARDVAGNTGVADDAVATVTTPGAVTGLRAWQIDNNVLLDWTPPASGTLPVNRYKVYRGRDDAAYILLGTVDGTFFTYVEAIGTTWYYRVTAVDSAGNEGAISFVSLPVASPRDFFFHYDEFQDGRTATVSNVTDNRLSGFDNYAALVAMANTSETWTQHFTNNSKTTVQGFIDAGHLYWVQPANQTSGYAEWTVDLTATVAEADIAVKYSHQDFSGTVTPQIVISYRATTGDPWTDVSLPAGRTYGQARGLNFRYVKFKINVTGSSGTAMALLYDLSLSVATKKQTDGGRATINASDAGSGGTAVSFNLPFLDVISIDLTPEGSTATDRRLPVLNFTDAPNPTSFKVLLYDKDGTAQSGTVRWSAEGLIGTLG